jgi:two-component system sensor histidine kinase MprB
VKAPGWHRLSLRSRIAAIAAAAVAVTVVVLSGVAFVVVGVQLRHQVDNQLLADARTVAETPGNWSAGNDPDHDHDNDVGPRVQVLDSSGTPLVSGRSSVLPVTESARKVAAGRCDRHFEEVHLAGREYRMLTAASEGGGAVQVAMSTEGVDRTLAGIGLVLGLVSLAGVAGAAGLGYLVARTGLAPVHRFTGTVEHVAATSDLGARIDVTGGDEVARLAHAFNGMLAALQSSRKAQRLLVEDAGHELRTPLTSLRANIELLIRAQEQDRELSTEDRSELLRDLDAQSAELADLVGELVDLARDGDSAEPVEPVDLAGLVEHGVARARLRRPELTFETDLAPVEVPGRAASLDRLLANLLDNAGKWSPVPGTVRVSLRPATGPDGQPWAELTVADAGPGIAEADLPRIFERFYRAPAARAMPGSGLGLAIVAQAVELHAGTVAAGRSDLGGALFTVRLPAAPSSSDPSSSSDS